MPILPPDVCFSNRPFGVKRFQTIHHHSVDVARGLVLLFGIGNSRTGGTIFRAALPSIERQVQADMRTHLIHRPARDIFHRSVELEFSPIGFDPERFSCCCRGLLPVHRNSVPSTQMRCMMTANRRAKATIAFFIPRRLAICMAQALSQDHFAVRTSMIWAAS